MILAGEPAEVLVDKTPNRTLGERLGLSPETIRTQLKKARKTSPKPAIVSQGDLGPYLVSG